MIKRPTLQLTNIALIAACFCLSTIPSSFGDVVSDFEDLALASNSHVAGGPGQTSFNSRGITYSQSFQQFGEGENAIIVSSGFSYSNRLDTVTTGFTNQYSAYTSDASGGQAGSDNYAIANNFSRGDSTISLDTAATVSGLYLTNTTYAYHAIVSGDDGNGQSNFVSGPFDEGDFFKLEIFGLNSEGIEIGQVDFYLADYRDSSQIAISDWTWVDLTSLGNEVKELEFNLVSSDIGDFGMNTPAYFAIDSITVAAVPEPGSGSILLLTGFAVLLGRSRRR